MQLEAPKNVVLTNKGKNVNAKWDADKFAAGYQVRYVIYDKYGRKKTATPKVVTAKKNKYTIKGLAGGEYVNVSVRAYTSKKYTANGQQKKNLLHLRQQSPLKLFMIRKRKQ